MRERIIKEPSSEDRDFEIERFEEFVLQLEGVVRAVKDTNYDLETCEQALDLFYTEGWDIDYSNEDNFYRGGDTNNEIDSLLKKFPAEEPDHKYNTLKDKLWKLLPDFYLAHKGSYKHIEPPEDYSPDEPFPSQ